jgi:hypothetical protein
MSHYQLLKNVCIAWTQRVKISTSKEWNITGSVKPQIDFVTLAKKEGLLKGHMEPGEDMLRPLI